MVCCQLDIYRLAVVICGCRRTVNWLWWWRKFWFHLWNCSFFVLVMNNRMRCFKSVRNVRLSFRWKRILLILIRWQVIVGGIKWCVKLIALVGVGDSDGFMVDIWSVGTSTACLYSWFIQTEKYLLCFFSFLFFLFFFWTSETSETENEKQKILEPGKNKNVKMCLQCRWLNSVLEHTTLYVVHF